jgi:hypothetical protein
VKKLPSRFPPSRLDDHAIELKPGAPAKLDCKLYRQTEAELKALKTYIDESLAKGYIIETNSPMPPLSFSVPKVTANSDQLSITEHSMHGQ